LPARIFINYLKKAPLLQSPSLFRYYIFWCSQTDNKHFCKVLYTSKALECS